MARELELDVEVLRAAAQKPAAKDVDKVQLLHQRVVVALHLRLEGLKQRREKLLQSRLQQPLTQERVAMMDLVWVETVEAVVEGDSTADQQAFFDAPPPPNAGGAPPGRSGKGVSRCGGSG